VGTHSDLPALRRAAFDPEPLIAEHAAWAVNRILERSTLPTSEPAARAGES
jgi:epoxyqueuosine reductase